MDAGRPDETDFDTFVASRGQALWRTAFLLTADHQLAEDLVQQTLVETWRRWSRIGGMDHAHAYVRRVMVTTHLKDHRRKRVTERPGVIPETGVLDPFPMTDLQRALRALPAAQRAVIVLRYFEDRTEAQTAEILGCSIGTVKSHHARAVTSLRTLPHLSIEVGP